MISLQVDVGNAEMFELLGKELEHRINRLIHRSLQQGSLFAKSIAPVDTGAYRASIYVVSAFGNEFPRAAAAAEALNPGVPIAGIVHMVPYEGWLVAPVQYARFVEFGWVRDGQLYKEGHFIFIQAAQVVEAYFMANIRGAIVSAIRAARSRRIRRFTNVYATSSPLYHRNARTEVDFAGPQIMATFRPSNKLNFPSGI